MNQSNYDPKIYPLSELGLKLVSGTGGPVSNSFTNKRVKIVVDDSALFNLHFRASRKDPSVTKRVNVRITDRCGNSQYINQITIGKDNEASYGTVLSKAANLYSDNELIARATDPDGRIVSARIVDGTLPSFMRLIESGRDAGQIRMALNRNFEAESTTEALLALQNETVRTSERLANDRLAVSMDGSYKISNLEKEQISKERERIKNEPYLPLIQVTPGQWDVNVELIDECGGISNDSISIQILRPTNGQYMEMVKDSSKAMEDLASKYLLKSIDSTDSRELR